jgi:hypothetical protein
LYAYDLVVDDEELICKWVAIAISSFSDEYEIFEAGDPQTALWTAEQRPIVRVQNLCVSGDKVDL